MPEWIHGLLLFYKSHRGDSGAFSSATTFEKVF
jgi:hypothetical protein